MLKPTTLGRVTPLATIALSTTPSQHRTTRCTHTASTGLPLPSLGPSTAPRFALLHTPMLLVARTSHKHLARSPSVSGPLEQVRKLRAPSPGLVDSLISTMRLSPCMSRASRSRTTLLDSTTNGLTRLAITPASRSWILRPTPTPRTRKLERRRAALVV